MKIKLDEGATMPTRAHPTDAGLDLYSREDAVIYSKDSYSFDTGVHMEIPEGYVGFIKSKSGLMVKYNILTDGTVDSGYTGSIVVKLFNHGNYAIPIVKGQKIAQVVILPIITPELELVDSLEDTDRKKIDRNGGARWV